MGGRSKAAKKSLLGHLFSTETLIFCVGLGCVIYGVAEGIKIMQIFFGICIMGGSFALRFVRKKDWEAHWAELERVRQAHEQRAAKDREGES